MSSPASDADGYCVMPSLYLELRHAVSTTARALEFRTRGSGLGPPPHPQPSVVVRAYYYAHCGAAAVPGRRGGEWKDWPLCPGCFPLSERSILDGSTCQTSSMQVLPGGRHSKS